MWYKSIKAQNSLVLLVFTVGMIAAIYSIRAKPILTTEETLQVQEKVFSTIFDFINNHPASKPNYYFISVADADPSTILVESLNKHYQNITVASNAETNFGFGAAVHHINDNSKHGIIVNADILEKKPTGKVIVLIEAYINRGASNVYLFSLEKIDRTYEIVSVERPTEKI